MEQLIIFGTGGHAREVAQLVFDINQAEPDRWSLLGFVVDPQATSRHPKPLPAPLLGDAQCLARYPNAQVIVAVGNPAARHGIANRLRQAQADLRFATLVHPRAWLAQRVALGEGSVVFAGVLINVDASIGTHASLNLGCSISHECILGNFVSLGPGVHMGGGCEIGQGADLGVGVSMRPQARVGAGCVIGAGTVVVADVPAACVAVGVPARPVRGLG